jgi:mono/diheme cytochrome c family protein
MDTGGFGLYGKGMPKLPAFLALPFLVSAAVSEAANAPLTFHKDVLPILQARCQNCHRPGEAGPMPLLTYAQVRPWAKAIQQAVVQRKMPPWHADPGVGHFRNDPTMPDREIAVVRSWVESGSIEGNPKDAPPPRRFVEGWNIGKPDVVFEMPSEYEVPATGDVEYTFVILPTNLKEDRWVQASETRPGNRAVVHHAVAWVRTPGSKWLREYPPGVPFVAKPRPGTRKRTSDGDRTLEGSIHDERIANYAPGRTAWNFPPGHAMLLQAGSDIVLQLHYTPNGKPARDRSRIGFVFAKEPPVKRVFNFGLGNASFVIPPGASAHTVEGGESLLQEIQLMSFNPHMHLRGKSMEYRAVYPDGRSEILMRVSHYDFRWQHSYDLADAKRLPKGTRLEVTAVYDNSANNPFNPDPKAEVRWGDQSWEEMMVGFVNLAIDPKLDVSKLVAARPASESGGVR